MHLLSTSERSIITRPLTSETWGGRRGTPENPAGLKDGREEGARTASLQPLLSNGGLMKSVDKDESWGGALKERWTRVGAQLPTGARTLVKKEDFSSKLFWPATTRTF